MKILFSLKLFIFISIIVKVGHAKKNTFQTLSEGCAIEYLSPGHRPSLPLYVHSFGLLLILVHLLVAYIKLILGLCHYFFIDQL